MVREKAGAAIGVARLLATPQGMSAEALLEPWRRRAAAHAKRLRKT